MFSTICDKAMWAKTLPIPNRDFSQVQDGKCFAFLLGALCSKKGYASLRFVRGIDMEKDDSLPREAEKTKSCANSSLSCHFWLNVLL